MPPRSRMNRWDSIWTQAKSAAQHSIAVKYIEENVDLIDTNLQNFMDDCPTSCQLEVYEMLLQAGIDMKDYVFNRAFKQWNHIRANPQLHQYYTIDYKQEMEEYINKYRRLEKYWQHDASDEEE